MIWKSKKEFQEPKGINFRCESYLPLEEIYSPLCEILAFLQAKIPDTKLHRYEDWWQHDGEHFPKGSIDFQGLFQFVKRPRTLYEAMPGDHEVRIGVAPEDFKWYLRMFADWDEDDVKLEGDFDITLPPEWVDEFQKETIPKLNCDLISESSETYYQRIRD